MTAEIIPFPTKSVDALWEAYVRALTLGFRRGASDDDRRAVPAAYGAWRTRFLDGNAA